MSVANPRASSGNVDVVTWLTIFVILLLAIPTRLIVAPLGSAGAPSLLFGVLSLVLWSWFQLNKWRSGTTGGARPVRAAMGIFLLCIGVSYVAAMLRPIDTDEISPADFALLSAGSWAGTLLIANDGITSRRRFDVLIRRLAIAGGLLALVGLTQFVTGQVLVDRISIPGLTPGGDANTFARQGFTRPSGTATHPIEYGVLLTMLLPLALHVGFHGPVRSRLVRWLPAIAIASVIGLSLSRSALVGTALVLVLMLPTWPKARRRLVLAGTAALFGVMFVTVPGMVGSIRGMFVGIEGDPSVQSRTGSYALAGEFIGTAPFFGRGLGTFLPKYWILDNQFLQLLITIGFVGVLAFLAVVVTALVECLRTRRRTTDPGTRDLAQSLLASAVAGTSGLAMFDAFSFPMTAGTLFLVLGLAGALRRITFHNDPDLTELPARDLEPASRPSGRHSAVGREDAAIPPKLAPQGDQPDPH